MRWIIFVIGVLFITACGGVNSSVEAAQIETELQTQATVIDAVVENEYNLLVHYGSPMAGNAGSPLFIRSYSPYCIVTVKATSNQQVNAIFNSTNDSLLEASQNVRYGLDGNTASSFDPTCDQIADMDRDAGDMVQIDNKSFENEVSSSNNPPSGNTIHVAIIGTGLGTQDKFGCGSSFSDHDNHIASIISELVPSATIAGYNACFNSGVCLSNRVSAELLRIKKQNHASQIINLSLGGPKPDFTNEYIIERLLPMAFVAAAAGNSGSGTTEHYPASFASGVTGGSVPNILAVGAYGIDANSGLEVLTDFNTSGIAAIYAPGVNLCPTTALSFRCGSGDVGISGTSFATPYVSAVAAMYMNSHPQNWRKGKHYRNLVLNRGSKLTGTNTHLTINFQ